MAQEKLSMPSAQGGLVRYFEESKSLVQLQPEHALILVGLMIVLILFLHAYGASLFGI